LQTRKWQDAASGQDRYATEIVVDLGGQVQMLDGRGVDQAGSVDGWGGPSEQQAAPVGGGGYGAAPAPAAKARQPAAPQPVEDFDDDIPF